MRSFLFFLVLIFLGFLFLPQILSTPIGKRFIEKELSEKTKANISIKRLYLSWLGPQEAEGIQIDGEIQAHFKKLSIHTELWNLEKWKESLTLEEGDLFFPSSKIELKKVFVEVHDETIQASGKGIPTGDFSITAKNLESNLSSISPQTTFFAKFQLFPSLLIDKIFNTKGLFETAAGPTFALQLDLKDQFLDLHFQSIHSKLDLTGNIDLEKRLFFPKKPLFLSFFWSEEFGEKLSQHSFLSIPKTFQPITLQIDPKKTVLPLDLNAYSQIEISSGILNVGRFLLKKPSLQEELSSLQSNLPSPLPIWVTPIYFEIKNQTLFLQRIDALFAKKLHLCSWGKIDLQNNLLNLILGIPKDTLEKVFKIHSLPENYVLQIPVKGSIKNPDISTGSVKAKIAAMTIGQQAAPLVGKKLGPLGKILESTPSLIPEKEAPPPQRPFPWEKG